MSRYRVDAQKINGRRTSDETRWTQFLAMNYQIHNRLISKDVCKIFKIAYGEYASFIGSYTLFKRDPKRYEEFEKEYLRYRSQTENDYLSVKDFFTENNYDKDKQKTFSRFVSHVNLLERINDIKQKNGYVNYEQYIKDNPSAIPDSQNTSNNEAKATSGIFFKPIEEPFFMEATAMQEKPEGLTDLKNLGIVKCTKEGEPTKEPLKIMFSESVSVSIGDDVNSEKLIQIIEAMRKIL